MTSNKILIINADDFGLSAGTNQAIIACHQAGSVSSTTLLVNMPATSEAVELAQGNPGLGVGLHFTLTLGRPVSPPAEIPSLVDEQGCFQSRYHMEQHALVGKVKTAEIIRELQAQMDRFERLGLCPTHLDSHQHVHLLPGLFHAVAEYCSRRNLPMRIPWVWPYPSVLTIKKRFRRLLLKRLIKQNLARWPGSLRVNQGFVSVFDLGLPVEEISLTTYEQVLRQNAETPLELMVHPARVDEAHQRLTDISDISEREYAVLSNCNLGQAAAELGYQVAHFGKAFPQKEKEL